MPTVTWLLTDYTGGTTIISGSPLYLLYDYAGRPYRAGYPTQLIETAECTTDATTVDVDLTAGSGVTDPLSESRSNPQRDPSTHAGAYTWQDFANLRVLLTFTVPGTTGTVWGWNFGNTPPIALKMKIKVKR